MQAKGCGLENEGPRERQSHADSAESCIEPRGQESFGEPRWTHSQGAIHQLMKAVMYTGCRAGELTKARRSAFDARTNSLTVTGKTGTRAIPLAPVAVEFFTQVSKDKLPNAWLLTRDDGKPWAHSDWDELVKEVVARAELPTAT
jgi:integrase